MTFALTRSLIRSILISSILTIAIPVSYVWAEAKPGQPADIEDWTDKALDTNASLAGTREGISAARAAGEASGAWDDPVAKYALAPQTLEGGSTVGHRFEIAQKLPWPDQLEASENAAAAQIRGARADAQWAERQLTAEVKAAYANWWYIDQAIQLHHQTRNHVAQLIEITEQRLAYGKAPQSQLLRLTTELDALDAQFIGLGEEQDKLRASLLPLLGAEPGSQPVSLRVPPFSALPRTADITDAHPLLLSVKARKEAAAARLKEKEADQRPSFTANAGYNSLWADEDKRWTIGVGVQIPFTGRRQSSAVQQAKSQLAQQEWNLLQTRREWQAATAQAIAAIRASYSRLDILKDRQVPNQTAHWQAMMDEIGSGRGDIEAAIDSARKLTALKLEKARLQRQLFAALGQLESWLPEADAVR